jgi:hypothetical protein
MLQLTMPNQFRILRAQRERRHGRRTIDLAFPEPWRVSVSQR